ncbi:MAG TPA: AMP-binding protein [Anaerolineales bacterium]|nr:AMP-binding protein [Anaerolineales bacterium]
MLALLLPIEPAAFALAQHCLAQGIPFTSLNLRLTAAELLWQLQFAECTQLIGTPSTAPLFRALELTPTTSSHLGYIYLQASLNHIPPPTSHFQCLLFTSGTTGQPKAVMLTRENMQASARASQLRLSSTAQDRWLLNLPLYHVGGLSILVRAAQDGSEVILQRDSSPQALAETLERERISLVSLVPTQLQRLLELPGWQPPAHLRLILLGGAAAMPNLQSQIVTRQLPVATTYGLTEAASQVCTALPVEVWQNPQSVGQALPGTCVRVVAQDGSVCASGAVGEVQVWGANVMLGYFHNPTATAEAIRAGWLCTGDVGFLDDAGALSVLQRRTDLIVSGGENVYPLEVERVLLTHPAVREVCVVGIAHPQWGQQVGAAIVAERSLSPTELTAHCRTQLAGYKLPRQWRFVPSLPQTANGKVSRALVKALFDVG